MAAQRLKDAARMLQGQVAFRETEIRLAVVLPGFLRIKAFFLVPTGEEASLAFFGILKVFAQNAGGVGEMDDVLSEEEVVLENVPDESAEKGNVAAGPHWHPDVSEGAGPRKAWIDMDDRGTAFLRLHHPAKTYRVRFRHRGAFDQNAIGVGQILLRSRSSAPAK